MLHWLVGVEVNYDWGTTLHAPSIDEEARVHKNKVVGMTCGHKCGEGIVDPTCQCDSPTFGGWRQCSAWMVWN